MQATPRALCCFDFRRKERRGEEVPNSSAKSPSQLNTSPSESSHARGFPPESTPTSRSENAASTLQRNRALTAGSPLEQPASKQSLSPSFSSCPRRERHPTPPNFGTAGATVRVRAIPPAHRADSLTSPRAPLLVGPSTRSPWSGQGRGRQRVAGQPCLSARGGVGGRI